VRDIFTDLMILVSKLVVTKGNVRQSLYSESLFLIQSVLYLILAEAMIGEVSTWGGRVVIRMPLHQV
jgi:hypothetical protein